MIPPFFLFCGALWLAKHPQPNPPSHNCPHVLLDIFIHRKKSFNTTPLTGILICLVQCSRPLNGTLKQPHPPPPICFCFCFFSVPGRFGFPPQPPVHSISPPPVLVWRPFFKLKPLFPTFWSMCCLTLFFFPLQSLGFFSINGKNSRSISFPSLS